MCLYFVFYICICVGNALLLLHINRVYVRLCTRAVECDACGLAWMKFSTHSNHKIAKSTCQLLHWHYGCYLVANAQFSVLFLCVCVCICVHLQIYTFCVVLSSLRIHKWWTEVDCARGVVVCWREQHRKMPDDANQTRQSRHSWINHHSNNRCQS